MPKNEQSVLCNIRLNLLHQRPSEVLLDDLSKRNCRHELLKVLREDSFLVWLGKLLKMVLQEDHGAISRKASMIRNCRIKEFLVK